MEHFCPCRNTACRCQPANHDQSCTPCIEKDLRQHETPSYFFDLVIRPGEQVQNCSIDAFTRRVMDHGADKQS
ncbi:DUF6485 family protein [Dysosmobacter sp.]|uniref:DUF6485 family protein n=1 Tax=Dysosmobacter sp. TaxID=2591382 RepID=UPI003A907988